MCETVKIVENVKVEQSEQTTNFLNKRIPGKTKTPEEIQIAKERIKESNRKSYKKWYEANKEDETKRVVLANRKKAIEDQKYYGKRGRPCKGDMPVPNIYLINV